jgi:hypothetical protein
MPDRLSSIAQLVNWVYLFILYLLILSKNRNQSFQFKGIITIAKPNLAETATKRLRFVSRPMSTPDLYHPAATGSLVRETAVTRLSGRRLRAVILFPWGSVCPSAGRTNVETQANWRPRPWQARP